MPSFVNCFFVECFQNVSCKFASMTSQTDNCRNLFYSLSHVLREFNHCYGFFQNASLCCYLDEELKHCLLFYHLNDDEKESITKCIECKFLKRNPIKYVSMALDSPTTNILNNIGSNDNVENINNLLLTLIYLSSTITLSPSTTSAPTSIMSNGNISILLNKLEDGDNDSCHSLDALTLHSICHCIDNENHDHLIETIYEYLGQTQCDSYFDRPSLSDKAVQFSTLRLQLN